MNQGHAASGELAADIRRDLLLSAIVIEVEQDQFRASVAPYVNEEAFAEMRARAHVFVYRRTNVPPEQQVLLVPLTNDDVSNAGAEVPFISKQQLRMLARLVQDRLPMLLPQLDLRRTRFGLERIRTADDLIDAAIKRAGIRRPPLLAQLHKYHRTVFAVREYRKCKSIWVGSASLRQRNPGLCEAACDPSGRARAILGWWECRRCSSTAYTSSSRRKSDR